MVFTLEEKLIGVIIAIIFILIIALPVAEHLITPKNLFVGFMIVLIVMGGALMLKNNNSNFSEEKDFVLDGQTQNVLKTSNEKSVDGKQVSFEEKAVTTTVTNESRVAS